MTSRQDAARVSAAVAYLEATGLPIRVICDLVTSYDTNELQCVFAFQDKGNTVPHYGTCVLCALPDGRLASGSRRGVVRVWDISTGQTLLEMIGHSDDVWCLAALAGGKLASGSADRTVRVWDTQTGNTLFVVEGHTTPVYSLAVLPGDKLASGSDDGVILVSDTYTGAMLSRINRKLPVYCLAVLHSGILAFAGDKRGHVCLWDVARNRCKFKLIGHKNDVMSLLVLPDGRLASGARDETIILWDCCNRTQLMTLPGHASPVWLMASLTDNRLLSMCGSRSLWVWDMETRTRSVVSGMESIFTATALLDGRLVCVGMDGWFRVWE